MGVHKRKALMTPIEVFDRAINLMSLDSGTAFEPTEDQRQRGVQACTALLAAGWDPTVVNDSIVPCEEYESDLEIVAFGEHSDQLSLAEEMGDDMKSLMALLDEIFGE